MNTANKISGDIKHTVNREATTLEPFVQAKPVFPTQPKLPNLLVSKVARMKTETSLPYLRVGAPSSGFRGLRLAVNEGAGFDFLHKAGDLMRPYDFQSTKLGILYRSRHKCGDAFDYDITNPTLIIVSEPQGMQQFFRTWLKCQKQDGTLGVYTTLHDIRGYHVTGWYFDFTACATKFGWKRIPAWHGWANHGSSFCKMEFWHYELTEGLSFDEAMGFMYGDAESVRDARKPNSIRILGLNDRGAAVRNLQEKLAGIVNPKTKKAYLHRYDIDGVFGAQTQLAVKLFQENISQGRPEGLIIDGLFGPDTRNILHLMTR